MLDRAGNFIGTIKRSGLASLDVTLHLDPAGSGTFGGTFAANGGLIASFTAPRSQFSSPPSQRGTYTVLLRSQTASATIPGGVGFGTVIINDAGLLRFAGKLADGKAVTQGVGLNPDGTWPFYLPLLRSPAAMRGTVTFRQVAGLSDFDGTLRWDRPADKTNKPYPGAFSTTVGLCGSRYSPPEVGQRIVDLPTAQALFAGGNLPSSPVAKSFTLTTANRFVSPAGDKSVLTAVAGSGLFSGTLVDVASGQPKSFFGAFFKADNTGAGFFKKPNGEIGSVEIGPP